MLNIKRGFSFRLDRPFRIIGIIVGVVLIIYMGGWINKVYDSAYNDTLIAKYNKHHELACQSLENRILRLEEIEKFTKSAAEDIQKITWILSLISAGFLIAGEIFTCKITLGCIKKQSSFPVLNQQPSPHTMTSQETAKVEKNKFESLIWQYEPNIDIGSPVQTGNGANGIGLDTFEFDVTSTEEQHDRLFYLLSYLGWLGSEPRGLTSCPRNAFYQKDFSNCSLKIHWNHRK